MSIEVLITFHIESRTELQHEPQNLILPIVSVLGSLRVRNNSYVCTLLGLFGIRSVWICTYGLGIFLLHVEDTCVQLGKTL